MKQNNLNPRFNDSTFRHSFSDLDHKMCQLGECVASKVFNLSIDDIDHLVETLSHVIHTVESFDSLKPLCNEAKD